MSIYQKNTGVRFRGQSDMMMEAKVGVICLEDGGRGHKPMNTGSHQKLRKARK